MEFGLQSQSELVMIIETVLIYIEHIAGKRISKMISVKIEKI